MLITDLFCHPGFVFLAFEDVGDAFARMAVAIGIAGMTHLVVLILIFKEKFKRFIDCFFVRANKFECPRINTFGTFGCVAHDEHRYTVTGAFFLNSTGIGEAKERTGFKIMAVEHFNRLDNVDSVATAQFFFSSLTDNGVHVNRIHRLTFRMFI